MTTGPVELELEADVLRQTLSLLRDRLPPDWRLTATLETHSLSERNVRLDATAELVAPDGQMVRLVIEHKRSLTPVQLPGLLAQLDMARRAVDPQAVPVLVARYLPASVRTRLDELGASYIDATGNMQVIFQRPAVFLRDRGADSNPWRPPGRPRGTLRGAPPVRVVRALADFRPPLPVRRLVELSGASTGATYRVLGFLEEQALLTRGPRGVVETVQWRQLLERWALDYGFARDNPVGRYLAPRGLPALLQRLADSDLRYAVTGSLAAQLWAPEAPPRLASIYIDGNLADAAQALDLRPVDTGANVLLATATSAAVFDRSSSAAGVTYAAPSQVAVDLLGGPGRSPEEGQALLDWMETHEPAWRQ